MRRAGGGSRLSFMRAEFDNWAKLRGCYLAIVHQPA
jgi:hypothetical protein